MTGLRIPRWFLPFIVLSVWFGAATAGRAQSGEDVLRQLTAANDALIDSLLEREPIARFGGPRGHGAEIMIVAAAHANPRSRHHHAAALLPLLERNIAALASTQNPSGLWDGGNIDSPPDSAFVLKTLAKGQWFLVEDQQASTADVRRALASVITHAADGVRAGGVHTPNHRWAICAALAHVNAVVPDPRNIDRIDQWLAEGIDVDADGLWAERSSNYTSDVNNPAILEVALLLDRPELLEPIRRSLEARYYFFEPNGEVDTVASRRQDQRPGSIKHVWEYYFPYRYLAVHDQNGRYAAVARWIEQDFMEDIGQQATNMSSPLTVMLMFPRMQQPMPPTEAWPESFDHVYEHNSIARIRRGDTTATVFGGSDWYAGYGHGSGLSTNPTFFKMRKGEVILESVRMAPRFFSTGFFYSQGLEVEGDRYVLSQELPVPYHLPMPAEKRNADGQYKLEPDMGTEGLLGRYFSKMGFADRPTHAVTLNSKVTVEETDGEFALAIEVEGPPDLPVTIELAFRPGGEFTGVEPGDGPRSWYSRNREDTEPTKGVYNLKEGTASYTVGDDRLEFGPGTFTQPPHRLEGETVTWMGGRIESVGDKVYLTGKTPFRHVIRFR
ncbi:hypothetical protein [Actomonas aquatica]|uniref:Heparinase II N-terminal domain-containing protein n=1 Tax=Actomonas aquatica TaxID=2866162 RepID=A0ABZ1CBA0_9BACT|nr:hypothetical protein [Opitutus sp. WL0086]WRQ87849.1 hypothetical protein K1X11_000405 [Opitutus sp. WL0086]